VIADEGSRFRLVLHYDGSGFVGWQLQPRGRTVQGELERALERLTGARRPVQGAGRTDTGVHATGQVAAVTLPSSWTPAELHRALNAVLPGDVWVLEAHPAPLDFHPRQEARARSYEYRLGMSPLSFSPFHRRWCWPLTQEVNPDLLHGAAALLKGERGFRAFAKAGQEHRGHRCVVSRAEWGSWGKLGLVFSITANRFLHHMVRYLVGTMVEIGQGRRPFHDFEGLLGDPDSGLVTSPPAPPTGLFMSGVEYPPERVS
jgi:tRNA pseudouridine38-40 synthase